MRPVPRLATITTFAATRADHAHALEGGRVVLPDGMSYRLLVLAGGPRLTLAAARQVRALVVAGATVLGPAKPTGSPSLGDGPEETPESGESPTNSGARACRRQSVRKGPAPEGWSGARRQPRCSPTAVPAATSRWSTLAPARRCCLRTGARRTATSTSWQPPPVRRESRRGVSSDRPRTRMLGPGNRNDRGDRWLARGARNDGSADRARGACLPFIVFRDPGAVSKPARTAAHGGLVAEIPVFRS